MLNQTEHKLFTDLLDRFGEKRVLERELGLWNLPWKKKNEKTFNPLNNSSLLPILRTTVLYFTTD